MPTGKAGVAERLLSSPFESFRHVCRCFKTRRMLWRNPPESHLIRHCWAMQCHHTCSHQVDSLHIAPVLVRACDINPSARGLLLACELPCFATCPTAMNPSWTCGGRFTADCARGSADACRCMMPAHWRVFSVRGPPRPLLCRGAGPSWRCPPTSSAALVAGPAVPAQDPAVLSLVRPTHPRTQARIAVQESALRQALRRLVVEPGIWVRSPSSYIATAVCIMTWRRLHELLFCTPARGRGSSVI